MRWLPLITALLLITAHRLPAPISEVEAPTAAPKKSAKTKVKPKESALPNANRSKAQADTAAKQQAQLGRQSASTANGTAVQGSQPPYAIPVPGHPDLVNSPYVPGHYIDIEGFVPGTEVKDPYAEGKTFLVPSITQTSPITPATTTSQSTLPQSAGASPVAKPAPNKPGFVYNPFDPNSKVLLDVRGKASGTKLKDPFSGKLFIVP